MYLKPNSEAPSIVPEPPKFLTEKDYAIQHVPKLQNSVSDETVHQLLDDRRTAEELYAIIFSEKNELEDFINQLKRNIQAYERFQVRVRRIYDYLKGNDVAVMATAKLLQKDLYIAERTVENLQIENQAFMATIQDYEEKQLKDNKLRTENEASLTHIKIQFQQLAEKVDEKNEMLGNAEERFQDHLIKMEQASSAATDTSKKLITAQGEIAFIKSELGASQLRESQLTDLNSELAQALSKLQNRNKELEIFTASQKHDLENKHVANEHLTNEPLDFIDCEIASAVPTLTSSAPSKKLENFYQRWSHIINELSSHSTPLRQASESIESSSEVEDFKIEQLISEQGDLGN